MNEQRFVARVSRSRTGLLIAGALGFVVACGWILSLPPTAVSEKVVIASYVGIAFFALCALAAARQLLRTEPVLEIDQAGILWRRWSDQIIPWSAIAAISVLHIRRQRSLTLSLFAPENFPGKGLMGLLAGPNRAMPGGDISLNLAGTDRGFDDMLAAIDHIWAPPQA
ncbi:hypothetical protein BH10PSE14_BH10PSE14_38310 [soil metagenome]